MIKFKNKFSGITRSGTLIKSGSIYKNCENLLSSMSPSLRRRKGGLKLNGLNKSFRSEFFENTKEKSK